MGKHKHDPKARGPKHHDKDVGLTAEILSGIIEDYNFSPKGGIEGLVLRVGERPVQVNVPPDAWPAVSHAASIGQAVRIAVVPEPESREHPEGEHPVYRIVSFEPSSGAAHEETTRVEGIVARFNYARHGERNGVILDNGDFVHLKPGGMKKLALLVGQEVTAEGRARPMLLGRRVVEAEVVNGFVLGPGGPRP